MSDPSQPPASFLAALPEMARTALVEIGQRRRFLAGTTLFVEGDAAHEVVVITKGLVKAVTGASDGRVVILDVLGAGALVGEVASVDGGPRSATVEAVTDVDVLVVGRDRFGAFLLDHPVVLRDLALVLAGRLRDSDRRQLEFGTGDSLQRLCARLVELADRFGQATGAGTVEVESPLNQSDLASWSGLSREAVVKSMRTLRDLGWITNQGRSITVLELDQLRARAQI